MDLDPPSYARLQALFDEARGLSGAERDAFVARSEEGLRPSLRKLLASSDHAPFTDAEIEAQRARMDAMATESADLPGRIGSFDVVRLIGEGGMGTVLEARQERPARRVALKVLRSALAPGSQVARFEREAEWLGRLHHPGIAQVYEAGVFELDGRRQPYLAMEYVDGTDLLTHAARAGLGRRERVALLARVCDAVEHAHSEGVLHRDLKPDNVLVDEHGQPKLLDFGIARALDDAGIGGGTLTADGQILGTVGYMAPEQFDARLGALGPASDVYALGVIGYELLTGRRPVNLTGLGISAILKAVGEADPPLASTADPALRGDVDTMLQKALERAPERRYGTAAAFAADLWRHLDDLPIHARPPSRTYRLKKYVRRQRAVVAVVGALALGLVGTFGFALDARRQGRAARAAATAESDAKTELLQTLYGAEMRLATTASTKPGGLANVARHVERWRPRAGDVRLGWEFEFLEGLLDEPRTSIPSTGVLRALDVDRARGRLVVGAPDALEIRDLDSYRLLARLGPVDAQTLDVAFSPDGTRVAASFLFGPMAVWDIDTEERLWVHDVEDDEAAWVAWHAGHDLVLRGGFGATVRALDAATGAERWREDGYTRPDGQSFEMAPDGERFVAAYGDGILVGRVRPDGLEVVQRIGNEGRPRVASWSSDGRRIAFGGRDGDVGVWSLDPPRLDLLTRVHTDLVSDVSFGPEGRFIASASWDNSAAVVGAARGRRVRRFRDADRNVHRAQWAGADRLLVTGDRPALEAWDWRGRGAFVRGWLLENPVQQNHVRLAARRDGGGFDAVCGYTHVAFDVRDGPPRGDAGRQRARTFARSADGALLGRVSGGRLTVEGPGGASLAELDVEAEEEWSSAWSPAGPPRLALANRSRLRVLDFESGRLESILSYPQSFSSVAWSCDGARIFLASAPGIVRCVNPVTGSVISSVDLRAAAHAMEVSPDGSVIAVGTEETSTALVLDATTLEVRTALPGHTEAVRGVSWHPDGTRLATCGYDGTVRIWDAERAELVGVVDTGERLGALAWSRDGLSLVAVTVPGNILCWSTGLE